jgi:ABC-type phosphate/phosphonate transport system substrate-binding protein
MGAAPPPPFRIAVVEPASGPCAPPAASTPAGGRAYFELMTKRLGRSVLACPVASTAEGAAGLAAGRLDMAALDGPSYPAAKAAARAAMTIRPQGAPIRLPVVLAVKAGHDGTPAGLKGRKVAFAGSSAAALALPRQVLTEQGYAGSFAIQEQVVENEVVALADLRAGKVDAMVLHDAAWQRQCRSPAPKVLPCDDIKVVWRARPQAQRAWAVRLDLPDPMRFRLLGVHMAMNLENRPAFAWAASQLGANAADFQPAEAHALEAAPLQ